MGNVTGHVRRWRRFCGAPSSRASYCHIDAARTSMQRALFPPYE